MIKKTCATLFLLIIVLTGRAQELSLRVKSKVLKNEIGIKDALAELFIGSKKVNQSFTDSKGEFVINVPKNGEYILKVSYKDCNSKIFLINTTLPENTSVQKSQPDIFIGSISMSVPYQGVDYTLLKHPLIKIVFNRSKRIFDHDNIYTDSILTQLEKIHKAENIVAEEFQLQCKKGNEALKKTDYDLAKSYFERALWLIPSESYPSEQLNKIEKTLTSDKYRAPADTAVLQNTPIAETDKNGTNEENKQKEPESNTGRKQPGPAPVNNEPEIIIPRSAGTEPTKKKNRKGVKYSIPKVLDSSKKTATLK